MRTAALAAAAALAAVIAAPPAARADDLEVDRKVEGALVVGGGTLYILGEGVFKASLSPDACRWCSPILFDRGVRDALVWGDPATAGTLSNITGFAAAPVVALGGIALVAAHDHRGREWLDDAIVIAEAAVAAGDINYAIKAAVGRERPGIWAIPAGQPVPDSQENNLSFYSGHSTLSMSLAVSAGEVASIRGYRGARLLWIGGVGLSLATGYLRIAADKHWSTDVLTGWITGAAVGWLVPRLHRRHPHVSVAVSSRALGVAYRW